MTRKTPDPNNPDPEPHPWVFDATRNRDKEDKRWWEDADKFSSIMATATVLFIAAVIGILTVLGFTYLFLSIIR